MNREAWKRLGARLRVWGLNLGLVGLSFLLAGLLAEGMVRLVAPQQLILIRPDVWQPADTVGWLRRPDVEAEINTGERSVHMITDAEGFRVGAGGRVESDTEILLIGDSFMEALQVEYESSVAGLLEERLPSAVGGPVAVRNAGIGGWDPDQYLLRTRTLLDRHEYDLLVVAFYLGNDLILRRRQYLPPREPVERHRLRFPRSLRWRELTDALLRPVNDFLEVRSHLFILVRSRLETLRMRLGLAPLTFPPAFLATDADSPRWQVVTEIAADIAETAAQHDVPYLFVLIPTVFQVDSASLASYVAGYGLDPATIDLEQPNRILTRQLQARGIEVLDLLPAFREAHERGEQLYGNVDPHFSPTGHELFVRLVMPSILERLEAVRRGGEAAVGAASR